MYLSGRGGGDLVLGDTSFNRAMVRVPRQPADWGWIELKCPWAGHKHPAGSQGWPLTCLNLTAGTSCHYLLLNPVKVPFYGLFSDPVNNNSVSLAARCSNMFTSSFPDSKAAPDTLIRPTYCMDWWRVGGQLLSARTEPRAGHSMARCQPRADQMKPELNS